jgi:hypothetical protein
MQQAEQDARSQVLLRRTDNAHPRHGTPNSRLTDYRRNNLLGALELYYSMFLQFPLEVATRSGNALRTFVVVQSVRAITKESSRMAVALLWPLDQRGWTIREVIVSAIYAINAERADGISGLRLGIKI